MENRLSNVNIRSRTFKLTTLSLLCALAIVLSIFECLIPAMPFLPPGAKLGLSNIVTMFVAESFGLVPALVIAGLKSIFVGVTRGTTAFLMSFFAGTISTFVCAIFLRMRKKILGFVGIGVVGALVHNLVQLLVAIIITGTVTLIYYLPVLIIFTILTGFLTGTSLKISILALKKIKVH